MPCKSQNNLFFMKTVGKMILSIPLSYLALLLILLSQLCGLRSSLHILFNKLSTFFWIKPWIIKLRRQNFCIHFPSQKVDQEVFEWCSESFHLLGHEKTLLVNYVVFISHLIIPSTKAWALSNRFLHWFKATALWMIIRWFLANEKDSSGLIQPLENIIQVWRSWI